MVGWQQVGGIDADLGLGSVGGRWLVRAGVALIPVESVEVFDLVLVLMVGSE